MIADRFGRTRALMASVLIYAVFTAACGLAHSFVQLAVFRVLLGLGMGGEWASGASLVSETWPDEHRGKALGLMQSSWAIGYALAAVVVVVVMPRAGWRWRVLCGGAAGVCDALDAADGGGAEGLAGGTGDQIWRRVPVAVSRAAAGFDDGADGDECVLPVCVVGIQPVGAGVSGAADCTRWDRAVSHAMTAIIVFMQVGMWVGYVTFGVVSDAAGRKRTYVAYLVAAAGLMLLFSRLRAPWLLFCVAPFVAFTATGYFTGFATVTAEMYETRMRSTAQGFTYNTGRIASAAAPFAVGSLADKHGFGTAFVVSAAAFVGAALLWFWIPETLQPKATRG